jgi:transcriptional regulator with XRE-family HTH domain
MLLLQSPQRVCQRLGERIRLLRLAQSLTQQELASRAGCSLSSVRRLEAQGQAQLELLVRVAQALQADLGFDALFDMPQASIADLQSGAQVQQRKRARKAKANATANANAEAKD